MESATGQPLHEDLESDFDEEINCPICHNEYVGPPIVTERGYICLRCFKGFRETIIFDEALAIPSNIPTNTRSKRGIKSSRRLR